jgi:transposase
VKPHVKRQKNDAADAEAICEAVTRANMGFVATKMPEQQSGLMLHPTRHLFIRQQTAVINAIRAHLAEFGIVAPVGRRGIEDRLDVVADPSDTRLPEVARACVAALGAQLQMLKRQILAFDQRIMAWHRSTEMSRRLDAIPGVGPAFLGLGRARAKAALEWRQRPAWQHLQARGPLPAQPVHGGRARRHPLRQDPRHRPSPLAHDIAGAAADQGCGNRPGQQDRPDGVGHDGQGRALQGTRRIGSVNAITPAIRRAGKVGRADSA